MSSIETRKSKSGVISYRAKVKIKGFKVHTATFSKISDAKKWSNKVESCILEGRYTNESIKHSVEECIDRYIKEVLPCKPSKEQNKKQQEKQLLWWKSHIGGLLLSDNLQSSISKYRDILSNSLTVKGTKMSASTVNGYLMSLSHLFTIAVKEWGLLETNPVFNVSKKKLGRGRCRFLSDDERDRLLRACRETSGQFLETIVVLALSTGARKMEILSIRWKDIDFKRRVITLHSTKNGEIRIIPLVSFAYDKLTSLFNNTVYPEEFVFYSRNYYRPTNIEDKWRKALRIAGIEDFRFHDLRHSAASYLAMNGATMHEIAEILGHKTLHMVKRYAHLSEAHTSDVVRRMNEKIFG